MIKNTANTALETTHYMLSKDGTRISYLTVGSGPALIVIPGALSLASDYATFARALGVNFTVHTIERRGRGQSGPQGDEYSIAKECEDVLALQQKTGATLLVGHSFGGLVALEAARNNQVLTHIAVYEPGVSIDRSIPLSWMPGYAKKLAEGKKLDAFVEFVRAMNPASRKTPSWLMKCLLPLFVKPHELQQLLSLLPENLREHQEVGRLDNSYENYRQIATKVLLMYGGKGQPTGDDLTMQRLAAVFSRSELKKFPTFDHFGINKGSPQEVAEVVSKFFSQP